LSAYWQPSPELSLYFVRIIVPSSLPLQDEVYLLRRLSAKQWDRHTQQALSAGFTRRATEEGLSVFSEQMITPRGLLQKLLDEKREQLQDDPQKLANTLRSIGESVEDMVDRCHWRIARVPLSAFPPNVFRVSEPDAGGHIEIVGTIEEFEQYNTKIARIASLLTAEECKR
jgi:hypothetical protein